MQAETLNCPMCGAPSATDATVCAHCGARLATVACPSCFGLIFQGAKFCSHCGAKINRTEAAPDASRPCPHCKIQLGAVTVGKTRLLECSKCEGIWLDADAFQQICEDREKQADVLGMPTSLSPVEPGQLDAVHYWPCPVCQTLMNRVLFAKCSHVVVDVCRAHGTWFDRDELRRIVEFIRAGGMEKSRELEIQELERKRSQLSSEVSAQGATAFLNTPAVSSNYDGFHLAFDVVNAAINFFMKK